MIRWNVCLSSGLMGMDLYDDDCFDDMDIETLKDVQNQLEYLNDLAIEKIKEKE